MRTSPPTAVEGLIETIARVRGVNSENILPGGGSSDLIFRSLRHWLGPESHALILDPTYGEYAHVLERVVGCTVDRLPLSRRDHYAVDLDRLAAALRDGYDLVVLVNPNSPTGAHLPREALESLLTGVPAMTRVWVDETYVEYAGPGESLERFAARSENVVVCKSMSKVYALSGARVAYLCAGAHQLEALRAITPPWVVSLPAQLAAVRALQDPDYYAARYAETKNLPREVRRATCLARRASRTGHSQFHSRPPAHEWAGRRDCGPPLPDAKPVPARCGFDGDANGNPRRAHRGQGRGDERAHGPDISGSVEERDLNRRKQREQRFD